MHEKRALLLLALVVLEATSCLVSVVQAHDESSSDSASRSEAKNGARAKSKSSALKIKRTIRVLGEPPSAPSQPVPSVSVGNVGSTNNINLPETLLASPDEADSAPQQMEPQAEFEQNSADDDLVEPESSLLDSSANEKVNVISQSGNTETTLMDGVGNNKVLKISNSGNSEHVQIDNSANSKQARKERRARAPCKHARAARESAKESDWRPPLVQINIKQNGPSEQSEVLGASTRPGLINWPISQPGPIVMSAPLPLDGPIPQPMALLPPPLPSQMPYMLIQRPPVASGPQAAPVPVNPWLAVPMVNPLGLYRLPMFPGAPLMHNVPLAPPPYAFQLRHPLPPRPSSQVNENSVTEAPTTTTERPEEPEEKAMDEKEHEREPEVVQASKSTWLPGSLNPFKKAEPEEKEDEIEWTTIRVPKRKLAESKQANKE